MHLGGQAMETSAEAFADDEAHPQRVRKDGRRPSVIQELKGQSEVFFDDSEMDGERTGMTKSSD